MMRFRQFTVTIIVLSLVLPPPVLATGYPVIDIANLQQNILIAARELKSNLNEAASLYNQVQQIAGQVQQIRMEAQNLLNYPVGVYNDIKADIEYMRQLTNSSVDLGTKLSALSAKFSTTYPGYKAPENYQNEYLTWTNSSLGSIKTALEAVDRQVRAMDFENTQMDKARDQSATAVGQMQVLQSANQISAEAVRQLQELRKLQAAEMAAQNAYMSQQVQSEAAEKAATEQWFNSNHGYESKIFGYKLP
ncbi:MAG TPA: P-type conjugative transfer protein TrbJ [Saprospiraceae bacterium]|nr:P-type conjugative transfer protein TrbJ [Saprospiraceae bacterium]